MTAPFIEIAGRRIGADYPPYVICELSGNHNGSLDRALAMVGLGTGVALGLVASHRPTARLSEPENQPLFDEAFS